jgi:hypothetical protein
MSLKSTSLIVQAAPLPATFKGTPNDFLTAMVQRMKILSPNGTNFIFIGDTEPTSNVGPWLKDGTKWYVWSDSLKQYVPLDISDSFTIPFFIGATTPASSNPPVWLRTTKDATTAAPLDFGEPIGWYLFDGTSWVSFTGIENSGPTASRPGSPVNYQKFYDTDISCLIWWERGAWRTVSGVPGDVKPVAYTLLSDALKFNPGWEVFGASNQSFRGRLIVQASKDAATSLTVDTDITQRNSFEVFGAPPYIVNTPGQVPFPGQIALWYLVKT